MGKINGCLKCLFIFFNSMFITLGVLLFNASLKMNVPHWILMVAAGMVGVHSLGVLAGSSEKIWLLNVFAGLMVVGLITYTILGVMLAVEKEQIESISKELEPDMSEMIGLTYKVSLGIYFGFAVTYFFGLLASCHMVHQVRRQDGGGGGQSMDMTSSV